MREFRSDAELLLYYCVRGEQRIQSGARSVSETFDICSLLSRKIIIIIKQRDQIKLLNVILPSYSSVRIPGTVCKRLILIVSVIFFFFLKRKSYSFRRYFP